MADSHAPINRPFPTPRAVPALAQTTPAAAHGGAHAHVNHERCRLSLIKGEHRWRFRWEQGSEAALISAVADLARNPRMNFDWFDAAVVCRHIAQGLPNRADESAAAAPSSPSIESPRQK